MTDADLIGRIEALAADAGANDLAVEAAELAERLSDERFFVACVGQFKRGKSTLLNALVGRPVLPSGVLPVTSVPTILRAGQPGARVRTRSGWAPIALEELASIVTEQQNPGNGKGVQAVEVFLPATVLEEGLCLVDTPGLGSVREANSAATRAFVPHIDAALVVLGADPPFSGEELKLVLAIAAEVDSLIFVVNKVDRVSPQEREQATDFLRTLLVERVGIVPDRVYQVVATGSGGGPDWSALVERLRTLARARRESLVAAAQRRGLARIGGELAAWLREERAALVRPVEEAQRRVKELCRLAAGTDRALRELRPVLAEEEERLSRYFADQANAFLAEAQARGLASLRGAWAMGQLDDASRAECLEFANRLARDLVASWFERFEREAEVAYQEIVNRFIALTAEQLSRLSAMTGEEAPSLSPHPAVEGFRIPRHFAFNDRMRYHRPQSAWRALRAAVLPRSSRRRRRDAEAYLVDLLTANTSRAAGDLAERVRESRREVEAEIRARLYRAAETATRAMERAEVTRAEGDHAVCQEIERLDGLLDQLERVLQPAGHQPA